MKKTRLFIEFPSMIYFSPDFQVYTLINLITFACLKEERKEKKKTWNFCVHDWNDPIFFVVT